MIARRHFLAIGGAGFSVLPRTFPMQNLYRWRGWALGTIVGIRVIHHDAARAHELLLDCRDEIERLEAIFSLHRPTSAVSRLNRDGRLADAPAELIELLHLSREVQTMTDGAFDVTVEPLRRAYAACIEDGLDLDGDLAAERIGRAADRVGAPVEVAGRDIVMGVAGAALTFDGIAQGYIADRIAHRLRAAHVRDAVLSLGREIRAEGERSLGKPWRVRVAAAGEQPVPLDNAALATSDPAQKRFGERPQHHHLFDPAIGRPSHDARRVSVVAPTATLADGLATALALRPAPSLLARVARVPSVEVYTS